MTNQSNPHSREQPTKLLPIEQMLWKIAASLLELDPEDHEDDEEIQPVYDKFKQLFDLYTAQKSLLSAKEEMELMQIISFEPDYDPGHIQPMTLDEYLEDRINQLNKEIKASRLDAEGGE
jgi:hypothetical protein